MTFTMLQLVVSLVYSTGVGYLVGRWVRVGRGVRVGQLWDARRYHPGLCVVVRKNDSPESPDSWEMRRLHDGKTFYMHKAARLKHDWERIVDVPEWLEPK